MSATLLAPGLRGLALAGALALSGCTRAPAEDAPVYPDGPGAARTTAPTALAVSAGGALWMGGVDGQIAVEAPNGARRDLGPLHTGAVRALWLRGEVLWASVAADSIAAYDAAGRVTRRWRLTGHNHNDALPLPDGGWLVAADRGDVARLGPNGALQWRARGHHGRAAFALALDAGATATSAGADGRLTRWDLETGRPVGEAHLGQGPLVRVRSAQSGICYALSRQGQLSRLHPDLSAAHTVWVGAATGLHLLGDHALVVGDAGRLRLVDLPGLTPAALPAPDRSRAPLAPGPPSRPAITAVAVGVRALLVAHGDGRVDEHPLP